mmetsp:Transcript_95668/g.164983  ORF Transcript_95668/g.164983 Transcript_95668/m.164983 type:complete len:89 (-) Transcript_95668:576-842(-)
MVRHNPSSLKGQLSRKINQFVNFQFPEWFHKLRESSSGQESAENPTKLLACQPNVRWQPSNTLRPNPSTNCFLNTMKPKNQRSNAEMQ